MGKVAAPPSHLSKVTRDFVVRVSAETSEQVGDGRHDRGIRRARATAVIEIGTRTYRGTSSWITQGWSNAVLDAVAEAVEYAAVAAREQGEADA